MIDKGAIDKINVAPTAVDSFIATLNALVADQTITADVAGIVSHALRNRADQLEPAITANHDAAAAKRLAERASAGRSANEQQSDAAAHTVASTGPVKVDTKWAGAGERTNTGTGPGALERPGTGANVVGTETVTKVR